MEVSKAYIRQLAEFRQSEPHQKLLKAGWKECSYTDFLVYEKTVGDREFHLSAFDCTSRDEFNFSSVDVFIAYFPLSEDDNNLWEPWLVGVELDDAIAEVENYQGFDERKIK